MLQSMEWQRIGCDLATEQQQQSKSEKKKKKKDGFPRGLNNKGPVYDFP